MALDDDLNEALTPLHFGFNAGLWAGVIDLQISRVKPIEDMATRYFGAWKAIQDGQPTAEQVAINDELQAALVIDPEADRAFKVFLHPTVSRDAVMLLVAMRGLLASADQMIKQAKPLGKDAALRRAVDAFTDSQPLVKLFRDVLIHSDEYSVGLGRHRHRATNPDEGITVSQGDDGTILVTWGGHTLHLLQAANDSLTLWRALRHEYWGKLLGN
ncbi:hypothetical protein ABZY31_12580 [Streptomyces sp. NPDC006529]|uniref:hypothetical protein n=1 Tax=Streptomyces sp. NPDC006529 TaxID=3157177 RepID=UPI0033ABD74A